VVIHQLSRLAEETNTNPEARVAALRIERDRLDRAIEESSALASEPLRLTGPSNVRAKSSP
jgi:hypothetical protein